MRNIVYFLGGLVVGAAFAVMIGAQGTTKFVSLTTAYASLTYMAVALLIGPWCLLHNGPPVVVHAHRRNIGIWSGVFALIHMLAGLKSHYEGRIWSYFTFAAGDGPLGVLRTDLFGIANYLGLFSICIVTILLAFSNNTSIKKLGIVRWKSVQRLNYLLFALVVFHAFAYVVLEGRQIIICAFVGIVSVSVIALQTLGFLRYRSLLTPPGN